MTTSGLRFSRYEVGERLGKGGFGVVHVAKDIELGREVAIKFLKPEYQSRTQVVQRFLQEARAAARIGHPGIVTVFECGQIAGTNSRIDGTAYIVMERLIGQSLADRITAKGRLAPAVAIGIARQLATALAAAHAASIIHRDLKPDNVYLLRDQAVVGGERVKILDFGVAKLAEKSDNDVHTHSQMMLGTPRYMAPEQARSASRVDHRSDIYGLGCMLYELVCGRPPFNGDIGDIIIQHQSAKPVAPRHVVPSTPVELDALILKMLAKQPDDRPSTMTEVDAALAAVPDPSDVMDDQAPTVVRSIPETIAPDSESDPVPIQRPSKPRVSAVIPRVSASLPAQRPSTPLPVQRPSTPLPVKSPTLGTFGGDDNTTIAVLSRSRQRMLAVIGGAVGGVLLVCLIALWARGRAEPAKPGVTPPDAAVLELRPVPPIEQLRGDEPQLRVACSSHQTNRNWIGLEACGQELAKLDPTQGQQFVWRAARESRAEVALRQVRDAVKSEAFKHATTTLAEIGDDSVYRNDAEAAVDGLRKHLADVTIAELRKLDTDCKRFDARLHQAEVAYGFDFASSLRGRVKCVAP
ncbi:MAG: protein kinase [Kofleriaceae bacterium]